MNALKRFRQKNDLRKAQSCNHLNMDVPNRNYDFKKNDDYQALLIEFRKILQDILEPQHDDLYLYRFLKARDFDLIKAEMMIRETFKFRARIGANTLLTPAYEVPEIYLKHKVTYSLGFDKDNNPIRLFMIGICDCKGFVHSLRTIDILKLTMYILECDIRNLHERKKKVPVFDEKITFILDFSNFSLKQFYDKGVINTGIQLLSMYQDHYPETLKTAYLINVPSYFSWVFNIFKPVLNSVTLSKIRIFKDDYQEHLRGMMDPQNLPAYLGGDRTDPDGNPKCPSFINWNPKIDSSYYMKQNKQRRLSLDDTVKMVTIHPRSTFHVPVEVKVAGSVLKWTFWTKEYNIRFGLFYKKDHSVSKMEKILSVEGVDCHVIPEENEFMCEKTGTYVLHFDNTYSWLTSKQIWYKADVEYVDVIPINN